MSVVNWSRAYKYLELNWRGTARTLPRLSLQEKHSLLRLYQRTYTDMSVVKMSEARTEALPQLILQLYIVVSSEFPAGKQENYIIFI